jgi:hypothetical protein
MDATSVRPQRTNHAQSSVIALWAGGRDWLVSLLNLIALGAVLAAYLSGKFSFDRFVDARAPGAPWLELRLWFTVIAIGSLVARTALEQQVIGFAGRPQVKWILATVGGFHLFLLGHLFLFGNQEVQFQYGVDVAYILLHVLLLAHAVRHERDLLLIVWLAEAAGVVVFLMAAAGMGEPELYGHGWAPIGSPITFYRIEFLTLCCGLYAASRTNSGKLRLLHLLVAAIGLYGVLASVAKAALLAAVAVIFYWVASLFVASRYRHGMQVLALAVLTFVAFQMSWSDVVEQRMSEAGVSQPAATERFLESLDPKAHDAMLEAFVPEHWEGAAPTDLEQALAMHNLILISDRTQRLSLYLHAWETFLANKAWGSGLGNYALEARNTAATDFDAYRYPHNIVLEVLAATGLAGGLLFSVAVVTAMVLIQQSIGRDIRYVFLAGYPLSVAVTALFTGDFYDFRGFWLGAILVICAAWPRHAYRFPKQAPLVVQCGPHGAQRP